MNVAVLLWSDIAVTVSEDGGGFCTVRGKRLGRFHFDGPGYSFIVDGPGMCTVDEQFEITRRALALRRVLTELGGKE